MNTSHLPSTNGVYLFKKQDKVIYIGKSINIKARVASHIENARYDPKEYKITHEATGIDYQVTDSEFKALLLESSLIHKYHPKYNVIWKDDKSYLYIKITIKDTYPKIYLTRQEKDPRSLYFGPFSSVKTTTELLRAIRKIIPFCTQKKITLKPCFYAKIGLCQPCPNDIAIELKAGNLLIAKEMQYTYRKNIRAVIKILEGKSEVVIKLLQRQLSEMSKEQKYEEALFIRNKIMRFDDLIHRRSFQNDLFQLDYNQAPQALKNLEEILKPHIPSLLSLHRIECYDISNLSQKNATASMVVLIDGLIDKSQYKRFRIRSKTSRSDFQMIEETLRRRFRNNWKHPNLLVIDGGTPQVTTVRKVFASLNIHNISVIGIAKNPDRIVIGGKVAKTLRFIQNTLGFNLIRLIRDESHRFARKYHLLLRDKNFLL